jgi:SpoIIAA-like
MIETLQNFPTHVIAVVCRGHVTKAEYDAVLVPAINKALDEHDEVRLYYETADDFSGIDAGAVWEDVKIGLEHFRRWERIAVVTDVEWIRNTMLVFRFLLPGETKVFPASAAAQARTWIAAP